MWSILRALSGHESDALPSELQGQLTSRSQLDLVAQTVEHRSGNAKVAGSNPSRGQVEFSACPAWYTLI